MVKRLLKIAFSYVLQTIKVLKYKYSLKKIENQLIHILKNINSYENNILILTTELSKTREYSKMISNIEYSYKENPSKTIMPREKVTKLITMSKKYCNNKIEILEKSLNDNESNMGKLYEVLFSIEATADNIRLQKNILRLYQSTHQVTTQLSKKLSTLQKGTTLNKLLCSLNSRINYLNNCIDDNIETILEDTELLDNDIILNEVDYDSYLIEKIEKLKGGEIENAT